MTDDLCTSLSIWICEGIGCMCPCGDDIHMEACMCVAVGYSNWCNTTFIIKINI